MKVQKYELIKLCIGWLFEQVELYEMENTNPSSEVMNMCIFGVDHSSFVIEFLHVVLLDF